MRPIDTPPADPVERLANALRRLTGDVADEWKHAIGRGADEVRTHAQDVAGHFHAWRARTVAARAYMLDPADAWSREDGAAIGAASAFGLRGFAAGLLLAGALAIATGGSVRQAVVPIAVETIWALGRFGIVALVVPGRMLPRPRRTAAYLAGLAPFVFGVNQPLRYAAFVASALLTFRGLTGAGLSGRNARTAIAWAFGGQLGAIAFGWLLRAVLALVVG